MGRRPVAALSFALVLATAGAACRDAPGPYVARDRSGDASAGLVQITFNVEDDRAPSWSRGGDSIHYSAGGFRGFPSTPGVLLSVPREGGEATPLLEAVQLETGIPRWLIAPVQNPVDDRFAFIEVWGRRVQDLCARPESFGVDLTCFAGDWTNMVPILEEVRLRVRGARSLTPIEDDPLLGVGLNGYHLDQSTRPFGTLDGVHVFREHPFQRVARDEGASILRPAWSPDGTRVAFSNGLGIRIWEPSTGVVTTVSGTDDAVSAAWSTDGEWLAFTSFERADSSFNRCVQTLFGFPGCVLEQTTYTIASRTIGIVPVSGGRVIQLAHGEDPAWAPDGRRVYFHRGNRIWYLHAASRVEVEVPGTIGGREPAVSPDGRRLAFARLNDHGSHDIWVLELEDF